MAACACIALSGCRAEVLGESAGRPATGDSATVGPNDGTGRPPDAPDPTASDPNAPADGGDLGDDPDPDDPGGSSDRGQNDDEARPAVVDLAAVAAGTDAIRLNWQSVSGAVVQRSLDGVLWLDRPGLEPGGRDLGLSTDTLYLYRLIVGATVVSNLAFATTGRRVTAGDHPPRFYAYWHPDGGVRLRWQDRYGDETGYRLEHRGEDGDWRLLSELEADSTAHHHDQPPGQVHHYRLRAERGGDRSGWATSKTAFSAPAAVGLDGSVGEGVAIDANAARPRSLNAERLSATWIRLTWEDMTSPNFVRAWEDTEFQWFRGPGEEDATHYDVPAIGRRAQRWAAYGPGGFSNVVTVPPAQLDRALAPPVDVQVHPHPEGGIELNWTDINDDEMAYVVEGGFRLSTPFDHLPVLARLPANQVRFHDPNGRPWTEYRLHTVSAEGYSDYTPVLKLDAEPARPATGVRVVATNDRSVQIAWDFPASPTYHGNWVIRRRELNADTWVDLARVDAEARSYEDTSVRPGTIYDYAVVRSGPALVSDSLRVSVPSPGRAPEPVQNLTARGAAPDQINLTWRLRGAPTTELRVEHAVDADGPWSELANLSGTATGYSHAGLSAGRHYYRVTARNAAGAAPLRSTDGETTETVPQVRTEQRVGEPGGRRTLRVLGTEANDAITIRQQNDEIEVLLAGAFQSRHSGPFAVVKVYGEGGDDTLIVDESVTVRTLLYGGDGADDFACHGRGWQAVVAVGHGNDHCRAATERTTIWADDAGTDTVENGIEATIHRIMAFEDGHEKVLDGTDFEERGFYRNYPGTRYRDNPFFGTGPSILDVHQGTLQTCPFTSVGQSQAWLDADWLQHQAVDLGDNTFAFRVSGGFHRIDGELYGGSLSLVPPSGQQWWPLFEKARYVEAKPEFEPVVTNPFRPTVPMPGDDGDQYWRFASSAIAAGKQIGHFTRRGEIDFEFGSPGQHAHSLISVHRDADGRPRFLLRNPYGMHHEFSSGVLDYRQGFRDVSYDELRALFNPPTISGSEASVHDPVALPQQVSVAANSEVLIRLRGFDIDGRPVTYHIVESPERGSFVGGDGWIRYAPGGGRAGSEVLRFRLHNGVRFGDMAAVTITIDG